MVSLAVALIATCISALLTGRFCRPPSAPHKVLVILVLFFTYLLVTTHIVAAGELLGFVGSADAAAVAVLSCLILAIVALASRAAATTGLSVAGLFELRGDRDATASFVPSKTVACVLVICGASWLVFTANAIAGYYFGYDGVAYHLPLAIYWLHENSFAIPLSGEWRHSLPANSEIGVWLLLGAGLERIAFVFNTLAAAGGGIAIFLLARRASPHTDTAILSAAFFLALPVIQFQATSAYVDLFGVSFMLAGIALFCHRNTPTGRTTRGDASNRRHYALSIALTGLAWGIAVGTKHVYYVYGAMCCAGALMVILHDSRSHRGRAVALGSLLVACMLVPSGFWLLRALFTTGNPFFPVAISFFQAPPLAGQTLDAITRGPELDKAFVRSKLEWLVYPWTEYKGAGHPYGTGSGVGPAWATFVPASLGFVLFLAARGYRDERTRFCLWILVIVFAMAIVWWFGLRRLPRFGILFLALSCILTAPLIDYVQTRRPRMTKTLVVLCFATAAILSTSVPGHNFLGLVRSNAWSREAVMEIPSMLNEFPLGTTIWVAHEDEVFAFALAGNALRNRVVVSRWYDAETARDFIGGHRVQYVADRSPYSLDGVATLGARVIFDEQVGPTLSWKIWAIPPELATPAMDGERPGN